MHSTKDAQFPRETDKKGSFVRQESAFRHWVTEDGSSGFKAEKNRYHLYVSLACPWASRTIIVRNLKRLDKVISISIVDPIRDDRGWAFREGPGCTLDEINGFKFLSEAYLASNPDYEARVTVPVLWDKEKKTIVSNESSDIMRMFNAEFNAFGEAPLDLYPRELRAEIEEINKIVYENVNNGVYRAGFAATQTSYEEAIRDLFQTLDQLETRLSKQRYLLGNRITEADWRLFTTLVRFDPVYFGHFKCNLRRLVDYPNLWGYTRDLFQVPGVAETVSMDHIKRHYYMTHAKINPTRIVPIGPEIDFSSSHDRAKLG